jgi:hypothetical protein
MVSGVMARPEFLTANAIADTLGMDRRSVMLRLGDISPDGEVHGRPAWMLKTFWRVSTERHADATGASNGNGVANDTGHGSYATERARWVAEKARLAELERLEREGALVPADQVAETWNALAHLIRTRPLALPAKCAVRVGMARNAVEVQAILKVEVREVLTELSSTAVRREGGSDAATV